MGAAEHLAAVLNAVAEDPAAAMRTPGRQRAGGAFETVERVFLPGHDHVEALVVVVAADFTLCHFELQFGLTKPECSPPSEMTERRKTTATSNLLMADASSMVWRGALRYAISRLRSASFSASLRWSRGTARV